MTRVATLKLLEAGEIPERYQQNIGTIGIGGQKRLLNSRVAIVGAGGLGGNIIEFLTRLGIGYLRIIDGDTFKCSNLNRQLLATQNNLGTNKAIAAVKRIAEVNSDVTAEAVTLMLDENNARELLSDIDIIVDALDNNTSRQIAAFVAQKVRIPLVYGAVAGFTGQVSTIISKGQGNENIEKIFSGEDKGIETILGNLATTPALVAAIQAQEVVKLLTGIGENLHDQLLYLDTQYNIFELFTIRS